MTWTNASSARRYWLDVVKPQQERRRKAGLCIVCGAEPETSRKTGRPAARCAEHLPPAVAAQRRYVRAKRRQA